MNRTRAVDLLDRLHTAQNSFYSGGPETPLRELLTPGITWMVPGENGIAGIYRGLDQVFAYFRGRRELAGQTFRMTRRDVLVGDGNRIAALTDGEAVIGGVAHRWSTVGLYEIAGEQIAGCWLLPLDQAAFDRIWSRTR